MATITLSVPDKIKEKMEKNDWINWSSVARGAFVEAINDIETLKAIKKIKNISEIDEKDNRVLKDSFVKQTLAAMKKAEKNGKKMSIEEFNKWSKNI